MEVKEILESDLTEDHYRTVVDTLRSICFVDFAKADRNLLSPFNASLVEKTAVKTEEVNSDGD